MQVISNSHPQYRSDIDGLRAVAIISVILFHAYKNFFSGGFVGVDIFFVISGYLISTIILSSLQQEKFSISDFYVKRIRRIFPALIGVLLSCIAFGWLVLFADEYKQFGKHLIASIGFVSNVIFWRESGYFDTFAQSKVLLHLWSLAIEEQFYLIWPILLIILWKKRFNFLITAVLLATISFILNIFILKNHPEAAFFLPITRAWELMLGGILAYIILYRSHLIKYYKNTQSIAGISLLIISFILINEGRAFPGWWATLPVFGSILIIAAGPDAWANKILLSNRPMIWIGKISYPMYLWHWPLLSFAFILENKNIDPIHTPIILILTVILAWMTYLFIEKPFRFGKLKIYSTPILLVIMGFLFILGCLIKFGYIMPKNESPSIKAFIDARNDKADFEGAFKEFRFNNERFFTNNGSNSNVTALIGDSHIEQYLPRINYLLTHYSNSKLNTINFAIHGGCLPIPGMAENGKDYQEKECDNFRKSIIEYIENNNIETIILGACWNCYLAGNSKAGNIKVENKGLPNYDYKANALNSLENFLAKVAKNKNVYLLLDNPADEAFDPTNYLIGNRFSGFSVNPIPQQIQMLNEQLMLRNQLINIAKKTNIKIIDPVNALCQAGSCMASDKNGIPIYKDTNHLRASFVYSNATYLDDAIVSH